MDRAGSSRGGLEGVCTGRVKGMSRVRDDVGNTKVLSLWRRRRRLESSLSSAVSMCHS